MTGEISGLVVVDADSAGAIALAEAKGLASAPCVRTSKGAHYYCEYAEGVRNFQKRADLPDIDLRAEGGYVVAPPSIHESGVQYQWQKGRDLVALPPTVIPGWVLQKSADVASNPPATMVHSKPVQAAVANNADRNFPQADFDMILKECAFLGYCKRDPASLTEAEWYAMITVVVRCHNGEQYVHQTSQPYPGYSWSETQKKIEHALKNSKPRTCQDIEQNINGAHCKRCSHRGKGKSPISLGRKNLQVSELEAAVEKFNKKYAQVLAGGKVVIFFEKFDDEGRLVSIESMSKRDFLDFHLDECIKVPLEGKNGFKDVNLADHWLRNPRHRKMEGIEFNPKSSALDVYNLFRGMATDPIAGDWSLFREHIRENICNEDQQIFEYVIAWMARIVQDPGGEKPGVALVLKGNQGTGKGIFATIFGSLFGTHFKHITDREHMIGQFNNLVQDGLVIFWDEACLTNDVKSVGKMKTMITEKTIAMTRKFFDTMLINNFVNLIMASNDERIIPASNEERRFLMLEVSNKRQQDHAYFDAILQQMDNGGLEAMLYDLLQIDISQINLRQLPKTEGLTSQKINNLGSVEKYWYERLYTGAVLAAKEHQGLYCWDDFIPTKVLYSDYVSYVKEVLRVKPETDSQFAKKLRVICPNAVSCQRMHFSNTRAKGYDIPSLEQCREDFDCHMNDDLVWDE